MDRLSRFSIGLAAGIVLLVATPGAKQRPARDNRALAPVGTATLSGRVVHDGTGRPIRRATVTLRSVDSGIRLTAVTGDGGEFAFSALPADRYFLSTVKPGFIASNYGAKRPQRPGTAVALSDGEQRQGLTLRLPAGGVITGTIRDRNGDPTIGARVSALRWGFAFDTGERALGAVRTATTDDWGVYRLFGLPADDYVVVAAANAVSIRRDEIRETTAAEVDWATRQIEAQSRLSAPPGGTSPPPGPAVDYAPVFYPSGFSSERAARVVVKPGEERSGIDITLDLIPTATISGMVVSPDGSLPPGLQVSIIANETVPGVAFAGFNIARVDRTGHFESAGLSPGTYTITVRAAPAGRRGGPVPQAPLYGLATATVNGEDVDTTIQLRPAVTLSGRLFFDEGTTPRPTDLTNVRINLNPVATGGPAVGISAVSAEPDGSFALPGIVPGRYRLASMSVGGPNGWQVRAATVAGRDMLDSPFEVGADDLAGAEIHFTDQHSEITGKMLDASGQPAPEYFILVFPTDRAYWMPQSRRIQSVRPGNDGQYRVPNLPPGDYFISAVTDVEPGEWNSAEFLAQLVDASIRISLREGEKKVQDLNLSAPPAPPSSSGSRA